MKNSLKNSWLLILLIPIAVNAQTAGENYLKQAEAFKKESKADSALVYFEKAAKEFKTSGSIESFMIACNQAGVILTRNDEYEKAKQYLEQALAGGASLPDTNNLILATTYISLGVVHSAEENYEQSLKYHHKALNIRLSKLGENSSDVATSYGNLGNVHLRNKDFDQAIKFHLKALKIREQLFGKNSSEITQSYLGLGNAYKEKKDYSASLEYFKKSLENKILQVGEGHKDLAKYYNNLSEVSYLMGNKTLGDQYKDQSEAIQKKG